MLAETRANLKSSGIAGEGVAAPFQAAPGKTGVVFTLDFRHPRRNTDIRLRVWALTVKGKQITLVATGRRMLVQSRDAMLVGIAKSLDFDK